MKNILVIGSANIDLTVNTDRVPSPGETVHGYGFMTLTGGKGVNQAVAVAKLGGNVTFLGAVGDDTFGKQIINTLDNSNVTFKGTVAENTPSGVALITVCGGDNSIIIDSGANSKVTPALIDENIDLMRNADYIIMQLEIPLETVEYVLTLAKDMKAKVILNPAPFTKLSDGMYQLVDILIPNEYEAELLCGVCPNDEQSCADAINKITALGVKQTIITLGERGSVFSLDGKLVFQPAVKTKAVDTTAAGDSFIGGLCCALCEEKSLEDAIRFATAVSSITVSRRGAATSIPTREEVNSLL